MRSLRSWFAVAVVVASSSTHSTLAVRAEVLRPGDHVQRVVSVHNPTPRTYRNLFVSVSGERGWPSAWLWDPQEWVGATDFAVMLDIAVPDTAAPGVNPVRVSMTGDTTFSTVVLELDIRAHVEPTSARFQRGAASLAWRWTSDRSAPPTLGIERTNHRGEIRSLTASVEGDSVVLNDASLEPSTVYSYDVQVPVGDHFIPSACITGAWLPEVVRPGERFQREIWFWNTTGRLLSVGTGAGDSRGWFAISSGEPFWWAPESRIGIPIDFVVRDTAAVGPVWVTYGFGSDSSYTAILDLLVADHVEACGSRFEDGVATLRWRWIGAGPTPAGITVRRSDPDGTEHVLVPTVSADSIGVRDTSIAAERSYAYEVLVPVDDRLVARGRMVGAWTAATDAPRLLATHGSVSEGWLVRALVPTSGVSTCEVFDVIGRRLGRATTSASGIVEFALPDAAPRSGIYFIRVRSARGEARRQVAVR